MWESRDWLYEGQHDFKSGYSCESQIIIIFNDISDYLAEAVRLEAIIIDFSKAFVLVPHDRLLKNVAATGAWIPGWSYGLENF